MAAVSRALELAASLDPALGSVGERGWGRWKERVSRRGTGVGEGRNWLYLYAGIGSVLGRREWIGGEGEGVEGARGGGSSEFG